MPPPHGIRLVDRLFRICYCNDTREIFFVYLLYINFESIINLPPTDKQTGGASSLMGAVGSTQADPCGKGRTVRLMAPTSGDRINLTLREIPLPNQPTLSNGHEHGS